MAEGNAVRQQSVIACVRARGYDFSPRIAESSNPDLLTGDGLVGSYAADLADPGRYLQGVKTPDPGASDEQVGLYEAYQACDQQATAQQQAALAQPDKALEPISGEWARFQTSEGYLTALDAFAGCMSAAGYEVSKPDDLNSYLLPDLQALQARVSPRQPTGEELRPLLDAESALRSAAIACWDQNLRGPLTEYMARIRAKYGHAIDVARAAYRGES